MQVYEILQKLLHRFHWIVPGYIMGGENRSKEKARLRKGRAAVYFVMLQSYYLFIIWSWDKLHGGIFSFHSTVTSL